MASQTMGNNQPQTSTAFQKSISYIINYLTLRFTDRDKLTKRANGGIPHPQVKVPRQSDEYSGVVRVNEAFNNPRRRGTLNTISRNKFRN